MIGDKCESKRKSSLSWKVIWTNRLHFQFCGQIVSTLPMEFEQIASNARKGAMRAMVEGKQWSKGAKVRRSQHIRL